MQPPRFLTRFIFDVDGISPKCLYEELSTDKDGAAVAVFACCSLIYCDMAILRHFSQLATCSASRPQASAVRYGRLAAAAKKDENRGKKDENRNVSGEKG